VKVSYIQPLRPFYEIDVSVFEGRLIVYIVSDVDLNLQDGCLYASACDQNSYSLRRHLLFLSQGPVLIAPSLAEVLTGACSSQLQLNVLRKLYASI
jgi:hypothetical protein